MNSPIRTCPICEKELPKEEFERPCHRNDDSYDNFHIDDHLHPYDNRIVTFDW